MTFDSRRGITTQSAAVLIVLVVALSAVAIFGLSKVGDSSGAAPQNPNQTTYVTTRATSTSTSATKSGGDYSSYLSISNVSATVTGGSTSGCDLTYDFCTIQFNPGSQVSFTIVISSSLNHSVKMPVQLNATITKQSGNYQSEANEQIQSDMETVNPSQTSLSIAFSIPQNAVSNEVSSVGAQIDFCGAPVSVCGFSNQTILYLSTAYIVNAT